MAVTHVNPRAPREVLMDMAATHRDLSRQYRELATVVAHDPPASSPGPPPPMQLPADAPEWAHALAGQMGEHFARLNRRYDVHDLALELAEQRSFSRACNAGALTSTAPLDGLKRIAGTPPALVAAPPGFPATRRAAHKLTESQVARLLAAYGLVTHGGLEAKRIRFCRFIGCPTP